MKIGFVSMPFVGHLNPMTVLGRKLQSRGHEIVVIGVPDVEPFARAADLTFVPFCEEEYPAGSIAELYAPISKLYGLEAARQSVRDKNAGLFAVRIAYHGVGEFLNIEHLSVERVRLLIEQVLENPQYRQKARKFQDAIARNRGLDLAAELIERAFKSKPRVVVDALVVTQ